MRISDILESTNTTHPITRNDLANIFGDDYKSGYGKIVVNNKQVGYITADGGVVDMRGDSDNHLGWLIENASAGGTSAGGIATSVGGFGSTQKRDYSSSIYPTNETESSKDMFGDLKQSMSERRAASIANKIYKAVNTNDLTVEDATAMLRAFSKYMSSVQYTKYVTFLHNK